jgi:hypothetical protein
MIAFAVLGFVICLMGLFISACDELGLGIAATLLGSVFIFIGIAL